MDHSESRSLGFFVYSQSIFLVLRLIVELFTRNGIFPASYRSFMISVILSIDVISGSVIYLLPKFITPAEGQSGLSQSMTSMSSFRKNNNNEINTNSFRALNRASNTNFNRRQSAEDIKKLLGIESSVYEGNDRPDTMSSIRSLRNSGMSAIKRRSVKMMKRMSLKGLEIDLGDLSDDGSDRKGR